MTIVNNVYFTPYGVGLGHASRLTMLAENIITENKNNSKINVRFSSFGEAVEYIKRTGYDCLTVPEVEFSWNSEGSFSFKESISKIPLWCKNFLKQVNMEVKNMIKFSPNVVVSDSRLSSIVSAKLLNIPSVVLLNQIKLLLSPRLHSFRMARLFELINGEFVGLIWSQANEILVPDLPPPLTISEMNTWNTSTVLKKIKYVGFMSPEFRLSNQRIEKIRNQLEFNKSKPTIFFHISGPLETRLPIIKIILNTVKNPKHEFQYIISEGKPNGNTTPMKISKNGRYYEWCPVRDELFAMSDILVLRGGHTAISQAIKFGKPMISIPIENHPEQIGNSNKLAKIGCGIYISKNDLNSSNILQGITDILNQTKYQKKATELMEMSRKINGIDNVMNIIRTYIK
ncbi:MAG: glycosyltransferase [Nitrososphaeraceae archaeon]